MKKKRERDEDRLSWLEYHFKRTKIAVSVNVIGLAIIVGGICLVERWMHIWIGFKILIIGIAVFSLIMETITFFNLRLRIRRILEDKTQNQAMQADGAAAPRPDRVRQDKMIEEMIVKKFIILWVIVLGLVAWFLWFGTSDFRHGEYVGGQIGGLSHKESSLGRQIRPFARFVFGLVMSLLTMGTGIWVTKSWAYRSPE